MGEPAQKRLTYPEYLAEEARSDVRHAFADGVWSLRRYGAGATVALDSLAVGIAVDDVYLGAFDEE
jgi:hypothetical protein